MAREDKVRTAPKTDARVTDDPRCGGRRRTVCASELAQMGVCERRVVFEHRLGKRYTSEQRAACQHGQVAHERFFREGAEAAQTGASPKGYCFIATLVYGEAHETQVLRQFRDRVLRPTRPGRWAIASYYRLAPGVCAVLARRPCLQSLVRVLLAPLVWVAAQFVQRK